MTLLALTLCAFAADPSDALPVSGWAVRPVGGPPALAVGGLAVVGGGGGTQIGTLEGRAPVGSWQLGARVPVAAWRGSTSHDVAPGDVTIEAFRLLDKGALGFELTGHVGAPAWTWAYEAGEAWPATGAAVSWQSTRATGPLTMGGRAALGMYGAPRYAPVPAFYTRASASVLGDLALGDRLGLLAEGGVAYWDPSPLDVILGARVDPADGVRLRGALVLPLMEWAGWGVDQRTQGIRDVGLALDLTVGVPG